jgi:hypothetical protein
MQTVVSPCTEQVRFRKTLLGRPAIRHTSPGHAAWQAGQRLTVFLRSSSLVMMGSSAVFMDTENLLFAPDSERS